MESEDLIVIVPNKDINDETTANESSREPYPFRSEIPRHSLAKPNASMHELSSSHSSGKKLFHQFIHHHRSKKLFRPIKKAHSMSKLHRSTSAPNMLCSFASSPSTTVSSAIASSTHDHHRSVKTFRQWFKSSSLGRFLHSFAKHPYDGATNIRHKSRLKPAAFRKCSDLIY